MISAEAVIDAAISWEKGGFQFSVGNVIDDQTVFRIEIACHRSSLLTAIAYRGEEMAGITDPPQRDGLQIFARADSPLIPSRIQLHDLDLRIRLPKKHALKGKIEGNRIKPIADTPAEIVFARGTLIIQPEAPKPIQFVLDDDEAVTFDPIYLPDADIGIEIVKLKLDMSETSGIPEVLARPGYDETWTGPVSRDVPHLRDAHALPDASREDRPERSRRSPHRAVEGRDRVRRWWRERVAEGADAHAVE